MGMIIPQNRKAGGMDEPWQGSGAGSIWNRRDEGEVLRVTHPLANTAGTDSVINPDRIHFSPLPLAPQVQATLKPGVDDCSSPGDLIPCLHPWLLHSFLHTAARVKFSNTNEIIPPV